VGEGVEPHQIDEAKAKQIAQKIHEHLLQSAFNIQGIHSHAALGNKTEGRITHQLNSIEKNVHALNRPINPTFDDAAWAEYFEKSDVVEKIAIAVESLIDAVLPSVNFKIFNLKVHEFVICIHFQQKTLISMIFSVLRDRAPPVFSRA
jgi:hypothetical protein